MRGRPGPRPCGSCAARTGTGRGGGPVSPPSAAPSRAFGALEQRGRRWGHGGRQARRGPCSSSGAAPSRAFGAFEQRGRGWGARARRRAPGRWGSAPGRLRSSMARFPPDCGRLSAPGRARAAEPHIGTAPRPSGRHRTVADSAGPLRSCSRTALRVPIQKTLDLAQLIYQAISGGTPAARHRPRPPGHRRRHRRSPPPARRPATRARPGAPCPAAQMRRRRETKAAPDRARPHTPHEPAPHEPGTPNRAPTNRALTHRAPKPGPTGPHAPGGRAGSGQAKGPSAGQWRAAPSGFRGSGVQAGARTAHRTARAVRPPPAARPSPAASRTA